MVLKGGPFSLITEQVLLYTVVYWNQQLLIQPQDRELENFIKRTELSQTSQCSTEDRLILNWLNNDEKIVEDISTKDH